MTKKVGVTLPDAVFNRLESRADAQGRTPSALAAFLIEYCLINDLGFVESQPPMVQNQKLDVLTQFLKKLLADELTLADLNRASVVLGVNPDELQTVQRCDHNDRNRTHRDY